MNFSQGHSGTKVQCESCLFSQGKTPEFTKMGEIHELFVLALSLVWFAGATLWPFSRCQLGSPDSKAQNAMCLVLAPDREAHAPSLLRCPTQTLHLPGASTTTTLTVLTARDVTRVYTIVSAWNFCYFLHIWGRGSCTAQSR